jgi:NADH-quinone oxidoreductase subunit E
MLTEEEKREIQEELAKYEKKEGTCIEAMKIVQRHRGWVSDESLKDIAEFLQMSTTELDSVATFYNLIFREPVGKHVVFMCNSISCWIMGYERLREEMERLLGIQMGETTPDGKFTFLPIVCLGTCDHAPALLIDGDLYRDVKPEQLKEVVSTYS